MKRSLFFFTCLLTFSVLLHAQTAETFDIATFKSPAGWMKQAKDGGLVFSTSDQKKGAYAMIVLYRSEESSGNAKNDFDTDWRQFVVGAFSVKDKPQMEPQKEADSWTITTGGSTFESELGTSAVILSTYSGFGKKFSAAAVFNSQDYAPAIDAFASSIVLSKLAVNVPAPAVTAPAEGSILGTWGKNIGAHMTYGDPVSAGIAGYSKDQYTLNANGTYTFVSKTFRMAYDRIILVKENGTYSVNGNIITIVPQKSVVESWSKLNGTDQWGKLLSSQSRTLERVSYRYTKHYFSGIDQWNLVLQADKPTDRDGPYSTFTLFSNAWYYSPISPNNPKVELPQ